MMKTKTKQYIFLGCLLLIVMMIPLFFNSAHLAARWCWKHI